VTEDKKKIPAYEKCLKAMNMEYADSGRTEFNPADVVAAVEKFFGEKWTQMQYNNALSTCKYRNLVEAVGRGKGTNGRGRAYLWTTMEIMRKETEPDEKPEPEPEPVEIPEQRTESTPQTFDAFEYVSEPVELPEAPAEPEPKPEPIAEEQKDFDFIEVIQGKRKRKGHQQQTVARDEKAHGAAPIEIMRTLHEMSRQIGDLAKQLSSVQQIAREANASAEKARVVASDMRNDFAKFDRELEGALNQFIATGEERMVEEVKLYRAAFINGWESSRAHAANNGGKIERMTESQIDVSIDRETNQRIVSLLPPGVSSKEISQEMLETFVPRNSKLWKDTADPIVREIMASLVRTLQVMDERGELEEKHDGGVVLGMPYGVTQNVMDLWNLFFHCFAADHNRTRADILRGMVTSFSIRKSPGAALWTMWIGDKSKREKKFSFLLIPTDETWTDVHVVALDVPEFEDLVK
jgi:hypothetical protein